MFLNMRQENKRLLILIKFCKLRNCFVLQSHKMTFVMDQNDLKVSF